MLFATLLACGKKADSPVAASGSGSGSGQRTPALDANSDDPTPAVIARAFRGKTPVFPLLSKDGTTAAVEITTPVGLTPATTYSVGFVTVGADAWSGGVDGELVTLVDGKLVALLLDSERPPTFDIDTITKAAAGITDRIARDGFTRFEGTIEVGANDRVAAGPVGLRVTEEATGAITIRIDASGAQVAAEVIEPVAMGRVGDIDCTALPHARRAWFDTARGRLLVQVTWNAGPDQCDTPDDKYRLYGHQ